MKTKNQIIYVDGYWVDTKETFTDYKCVIGEWDGIEDDVDQSIFYYFENEDELKDCQTPRLNHTCEFCITAVRRE